MEAEFNAVKELISKRFEPVKSGQEQEPEDEFILRIAERVADLMETNMELFFNHLYRMDVDERKIRFVLSLESTSDENVYISIAKLIYQRQKQRLESRQKYKQDKIDFWAEE